MKLSEIIKRVEWVEVDKYLYEGRLYTLNKLWKKIKNTNYETR